MKRRNKMSHHLMRMSYEPKNEAVFSGKCRQTIRKGRDYAVGDTLEIYESDGNTPNLATRSVKAKVVEVMPIAITSHGIGTLMWTSRLMDHIAKKDGIDPPTGIELKRVLESFYGAFPPEGVEAQIVRWEPLKEDEQ